MESNLNANEKAILAVIKERGEEGIDSINLKRFFNKKMRYIDVVLSYRKLLKMNLITKTPIRVEINGESVITKNLTYTKKK